MDNKPKQYVQGWVEFYKLRFKVTPDVLIPRPETELLVDEVLRFVRDSSGPLAHRNDNDDVIVSGAKQSFTILDLGTGSGNIAISIAKNIYLPTWSVGTRIIATDISPKASKIAQQNAKLHQVEDRIIFFQSNLLSAFRHSGGNLRPIESDPIVPISSELQDNVHVDIIVTNLPYIPSARIPYLDSSVKDFEPHVALDGGEDGFELYRQLFQQIKEKGWKPKLILGEIDYTHGELAQEEAQKYFPEAQVEVKTDLAHKQRILRISF
ncbi:MAG: HemK/PrmC family methyltransferase [bacterium]|nr:HemK/PrmC family methyltransferase [bacterium]